MAAAQPADTTAWIAVSPDTDPLVRRRLAGGPGLGPGPDRPGVHPLRRLGDDLLTVEVDDLAARLRWLRDLGATPLQEATGAALVEDFEGNRALLLQRRPDPPARPYRA